VNGEAATAAEFAGHWAERTRSPAYPVQGQRIYELDRVQPVRATTGVLRAAAEEDGDTLVQWMGAFERETGAAGGDPATVVGRRLPAGQLWIWDDGSPVAMAGISAPVAGVGRVGPVYTPPERRGRGYATALVAGISGAARLRGERCILYTDLGNPVSNSISRNMGYQAVTEALWYRFGPD
jgi:predicted GNAT family acetyltransferase